jgi:leucyl aminopeptidase
MKISVAAGKIDKLKAEGAVILLFEDEKPDAIAGRVDKVLGGTIARLVKRGDFKPKPGAVHLLYPEGRIAAERLVLAGLGKREDFNLNWLRQAAGKAAPYLRAAGAADITFSCNGIGLDPEETAQALIEGSLLGLYRFLKYKTSEDNNTNKNIRAITLVTEHAPAVKALQAGVRTGEIIAESTPWSVIWSVLPRRHDAGDYCGESAAACPRVRA